MNKSISKEDLRDLPLNSFSGKIIVIDRAKDINKVLPEINSQKILGFDTETKPNFKKGRRNEVALLQLSTSDTAYLFRLNKTGLSKELTDILADGRIIKAGVAIRDDINDICRLRSFKPAGFVEIQEKVKEFDIENFGLKKLSGLLLGFRISKAQQTSNWEADVLTEAQLNYAATDAWVSLEIYKKLVEMENI